MTTGLIYPNGRPVTQGDVALVKAKAVAASLVRGDAPYTGARQVGTFLQDWRPSLRSADADYLPDRDRLVARIRDLLRNDPAAAAIPHRRVNSAIGTGWRRSSRPDYRTLGIKREVAAELGRMIEAKWSYYAYGAYFQIDAQRRLNLGQLLRLCTHHLIGADGEALALVEWDKDATTKYKTRLRVVDPDRLSNPYGQPDSPTLRGGVESDLNGVPYRYWIREAHPSDLGNFGGMTWSAWDRFTEHGRHRVLHAFDVTRAGQTRGISRFAAALKTHRGLQHFTDAQVEAATLNALFIAFVKSSSGPDAVNESFSTEDLIAWSDARHDGYEKNPVSLTSGARMPVLGYGDEVSMQTAARDVSDFEPFHRAITRLTYSLLGATYEEGSMDYSNTNYSSARAAFIPAWHETLATRSIIDNMLATPLFMCWLEEAFDIGEIVAPPGAPDFADAPEAYADGRWVAPGRGYVDPVKEIDAAAARIEAGTSTLELEAAEQGLDWEELLEQRRAELDRYEALGMTPPTGALSLAAAAARQPEQATPPKS